MSTLKRTKCFAVKRIRAGIASHALEELLVEQTVTLLVNGERLLSFQFLPEMPKELVVGFLITEGLVSSIHEILDMTYDDAMQEVLVSLKVDASRIRDFQESLVSGSSCGKALSARGKFDPLDCKRKIDMSFCVEEKALFEAMGEFRRRTAHPHRPQGAQAAAIAQGVQILVFAEDVGRHNAVDKVIGACALRGIALTDKLLLTTGRISLELAAKALRAGLPLIASTHGPTAAAVELARDAAITLIGFVSAAGMRLYSAEWRVAPSG